MTRQDELNEALTRRLTEVMAAAGVPHARASLEVLYMLPVEFLRRYAELFHEALKFGDSPGGDAVGKLGKAGSGAGAYTGKRPMVSGGAGKKYKEHWIVKDDDALDLKGRIDKRLRALGREIMAESEENKGKGEGNDGEKKTRCTRCGRWFGHGWNFCAWCGNHRPHGE